MQGKTAYIRPKVVGPFPGPCASGSYVHWAALFFYVILITVVGLVISTTNFFNLLCSALIESDAEGIGGSGFVECIREHIIAVLAFEKQYF
jgi:hypothetical protein